MPHLPSLTPRPHRPNPQIPPLETRLFLPPPNNLIHQFLLLPPALHIRQLAQLRLRRHDHRPGFGKHAECLSLAPNRKIGRQEARYTSCEEICWAENVQRGTEWCGGRACLDECRGARVEGLRGVGEVEDVWQIWIWLGKVED
jgi:hypothetical protein